MLQACFEKHNSFLRPLKKKGFKEERVTTIGLYDIGKSHDPGIQQEPPAYLPCAGALLAGAAWRGGAAVPPGSIARPSDRMDTSFGTGFLLTSLRTPLLMGYALTI